MREPSLDELRQLLETEEYAQVEVLDRLPDDLSTLQHTLASLALEGGGTLIIPTDVRGAPGDAYPDTAETVDRLQALGRQLSFECGANAVSDDLRNLAYVAVASVEAVPNKLDTLTESQVRLLSALWRAQESGSFAREHLATVTHNDGWSVHLKNIAGGRSRRIYGFSETDLYALKDEGIITLLDRKRDATLSLKPQARKVWLGAVAEVLGSASQVAASSLPGSANHYDVFLCHASEQKKDVVDPLCAAFEKAGITCWYDKEEIAWGQSITARINDGLGRSQFVIAVLSKEFVGKGWPERELNAALGRETSSGDQRVLPLLVGEAADRKAILDRYPLIEDKRYMPWDDDPQEVVLELRRVLKERA